MSSRISNNNNFLPPGFHSVQDFLLHCHKRSIPFYNAQNGPSNSIDSKAILDQQHPYKVEPCISSNPGGKKPSGTGKRYYYEQSTNSAVLPSDLPKPKSIKYPKQ